jgi:uncharacterized surface anchored protein
LLHLFGALAMLVGLLIPLTDVGLAAPAPVSSATTARPQGAAQQVTMTCDGNAAPCQGSQLTNDDGIWTGTFALPAGSYSWQFAVVDASGQSSTVGPHQLTIGDSQTAGFFLYDSHTNTARAQGVAGTYTAQTDQGELPLIPKGNDLFLFVTSDQGGPLGATVMLDGQPVGEQQSANLQPGLNVVTFDPQGNVTNSQPLTAGSLTITRTDAQGNPLAGGCYQLKHSGQLANQACDADDGADGTTTMTFPEGFTPGQYTLSETQAPDGAEKAPDQQLTLQAGQNTAEMTSPGGAATEEATAPPTQAATTAPTEAPTQAATEAPTQGGIGPVGPSTEAPTQAATQTATEAPQPGDLIVTLQDQDGNAIGGACFQLLQDGNVISESCDSQDQFPNNGNTGFFGVPAGSYTVHESQTPEGSETAKDKKVTIKAGQETDVTITAKTIAPTQPPTLPPTQPPTPTEVPTQAPTLPPTLPPTQAPTQAPTQIPTPPATQAPTNAVVPRTPSATTAPTQTATEAPQPGDLIVTLQDEAGNAIGGACFQLLQDGNVVSEACDNQDQFPNNGNTGFFGVPAGDYTLHESQTPDGSQTAKDRKVTVKAGQETDLTIKVATVAPTQPATAIPTKAPTLPPTQVPTHPATVAPTLPATVPVTIPATVPATIPATQAPTAPPSGDTGNLIVIVTNPAPGNPVCVQLNTTGGIGMANPPSACDNGAGDGNDAAGRIELTDIPAGEYALQVTSGPASVASRAPATVTITAGQTTTVTLGQGGNQPTAPATAQPTLPATVPATVAPTTPPTQAATATPALTPTGTPSSEWGSLNLTVVNEQGDPVPGACFTITSGTTGNTYGPHCDTTGTGKFTIPQVGPGKWTIRMTQESLPAGYTLPAPIDPTVTAGQASAVKVTLTKAATPAPTGTPATTTTPVPTQTQAPTQAPTSAPTQAPTKAPTATPTQPPATATSTARNQPLVPVKPSTPQPTGGTLPVIAVDAKGNKLPGACWELIGTSNQFGPLCDNGANGGTAGDGQVTFENIPAGSYTLRETTPPAGFLRVDDRTISVKNGANDPVMVQHQPAPGAVQITTSSSGGGILTGACYAIDGGTPLCDVDNDGVINFKDVAPGTHTLSQTTAPEGYEKVKDRQIDVAAGETLQVGIVNQAPATGNLNVAVQDSKGNAANGACAAVDGGTPVCDGDPNDAASDPGVIGFTDLSTGKHNVAITSVPSGFEKPTSGKSGTVKANETTIVTFALKAAPPQTGSLRVFFNDQNGKAVPKACAQLTNSAKNIKLGPYCDGGADDASGDPGVLLVKNINVGTYLVSVTPSTPPIDGFQSATSSSVTIQANATVDVHLVLTIIPKPTTGTVEIVTRDGNTDALVGHECYELRGTGNPIKVCDNDQNDVNSTIGVIKLLNVPAGTYTLAMTTTPDGYVTMPDRTGVKVTAGATTRIDVALQPKPQAGTLVVKKVDQNNKPLGGACFQVQQGNTIIASLCDATDGNPSDGTLTFKNLKAGSYLLVESKAPTSDYQPADPQTVTVTAGKTTTVTVPNTPNPGRVEVFKVDAGNTNKLLENACFQLTGPKTYGPFCDNNDGSSDGKTVFTNVVPGTYTLKETVAPYGYVPAKDTKITVNPGDFLQVVVKDQKAPPPKQVGRLIVRKQNAQKQVLPGGCFRLYNGNTPVTGQACDIDDGVNDGAIIFNAVPVGTWTLRETLAPSPDFQLAPDQKVTIVQNKTVEVPVIDRLKTGRVLVNKTNPQGNPLQNACFDLAPDGKGSQCSDASGRIVFDNLQPGTYALTETKAPYGYAPAPKKTGIKVQPGQTTVLNIVDQLPPPPPDTGSVQVQKFVCPAGQGGERTTFLNSKDGMNELAKTAGCVKGNAEFTLIGQNGSGGPGAFATGDGGQYQVTLKAGTYILTETNPDLPGSSSAQVAVFVNQLTTVVVINYVAPPKPQPVTINVAKYTCPPSFNGTLYDDFAQGCVSDTRLTNNVTIRAEGPVKAKHITGDTGQQGQTAFTGLPAGAYSIFEERPYNMPTAYMFCGFNANYPADYKVVNGSLDLTLQAGAVLTCQFFNIPEILTPTTGTILVHKYLCDVNTPPANYDWYKECQLSDQQAKFSLATFNPKNGQYTPFQTAQANPDGILRFVRLQPGSFQLKEIGAKWCHAESNSVNSKGDVVVTANKLSEVWIFNCVPTKSPPNTGVGPLAGPLEGGANGAGILLGLAWPLALLGGWDWWRRRRVA